MSSCMMTATSHGDGEGRKFSAAAMALLLIGAPGFAHAAAPGWLKHAFTLHGPTQSSRIVARYRMDSGGNFVLDRSALWPLLKFDDSPEVWVLSASRGPRGDMIYTSDLGRPLLRMTSLGGVTVFTTGNPAGSAAAAVGVATPLRMMTVGPAGLYRILLQASARASRAARHLVGFEAPEADAASDGLIADAAMVASEAMVTLSSDSEGRSILNRVARVEILRGGQPGASLRGSVVDITVAPVLGVAGRPSSQRIRFAVGAR